MHRSAKQRWKPGKALAQLLIVAALLVFAPSVFAASTPQEYLVRLERAEKIADDLGKGNFTGEQVVTRLSPLKRLLPAFEEVESSGRKIRVDNRWLHEAVDQVIKNADTDVEQRRSMLVDLWLRCSTLKQRVKQGIAPAQASDQATQAKLDEILARPEYRPSAYEESSVRKLWTKLKRFFSDLLNRLFGSRSQRVEGQINIGKGATIFRGVILLATAAALIYGIYKLSRLRFRRKLREEEAETREVLGEEIASDATAADLLSAARELARKGEFRAAIRRTYIAMLFEYEQRGQLHLHRAKTNRDYLNALRAETGVFPGFASMTNVFERVWYGQRGATEEEFHRFVAQYHETTKP